LRIEITYRNHEFGVQLNSLYYPEIDLFSSSCRHSCVTAVE